MSEEPNEHKRCSRCGEVKPVGDFSRNLRRKDGLGAWCKRCCRADYLTRRPPGGRQHAYPQTRNRLRQGATEKRCAVCGRLKSRTEFRAHRRHPDGRTPRCAQCLREGARAYWRRRRGDPEFRQRRRLSSRRWYEKNLEARQAAARETYDLRRAEVIATHGGRCMCCGETTPEFLVVDHTNGGGNQHRRSLGIAAGQAFYVWLKRQGYPQDGFRLLCHNCNAVRAHRAYCPHDGRTT